MTVMLVIGIAMFFLSIYLWGGIMLKKANVNEFELYKFAFALSVFSMIFISLPSIKTRSSFNSTEKMIDRNTDIDTFCIKDTYKLLKAAGLTDDEIKQAVTQLYDKE